MAFYPDDVKTAIRGLFDAAWVATPMSAVSFDDSVFDSADQSGPWVEIKIQDGAYIPTSIALSEVSDGFIWFTAYELMNNQTDVVNLLIRQAFLIFDKTVRLPVGSDGALMMIAGTTSAVSNTRTGFYGKTIGFRFFVR